MQHVLSVMAEKQKQNLSYTIVALGDSVTDGCFRREKDPEHVWHAVLKRLLNGIFPDLRINVINSGVGGDSAAGALKRLDRDVLRYQPDLVIVCLGLNDVCGEPDRYVKTMSEIFDRLLPAGADVIALTPNMVDTELKEAEVREIFGEQWAVDYAEKLAGIQKGTQIDEMYDKLKAAARSRGIAVCDVYSCWRNLDRAGADITSLLANRINHPTREMHAVFAAKLLSLILD